jgi:hypothetical protein
MPLEMKTAQVNLRIRPSLKAAAEQAAADDHRSLTSLVEKLLTDHLRARPVSEVRRTDRAA